jgi:competence protein ComEA
MRCKSFIFRILHSAIRIRQIPHPLRYFSLGQQKVLFLLALFILVIVYLKFYYHSLPRPSEELNQEIVVEVFGEVRNPGIQIFHHSPTLKECIEKGGGLKDAAFFDRNPSLGVLETGTLVTIKKESPQEIKVRLGRMEARKLLVFSIPLDLNRVTVEDLCLVPGIGESLAQEILTYRKKRKGFLSVDDLKNVKGIGEKKWSNLKRYFAVEK